MPAAAQRHSSPAERIPCASRNQAGAEKQKSEPDDGLRLLDDQLDQPRGLGAIAPGLERHQPPSCATASQIARAAARQPAAPLQPTPTQRRGPKL